jgi:hypothetical protein
MNFARVLDVVGNDLVSLTLSVSLSHVLIYPSFSHLSLPLSDLALALELVGNDLISGLDEIVISHLSFTLIEWLGPNSMP